jgi:hypothetical protein
LLAHKLIIIDHKNTSHKRNDPRFAKYANLTPFSRQCNTGLTLDLETQANRTLRHKSGVYPIAPLVTFPDAERGSQMVTQPYDIFRRDETGDPVWIEAVSDLETAKTRIIELSSAAPGQYVVFNHSNGRMVSSGTVITSPAARATGPGNRVSTSKKSAEVESDTLWK